MPYQQIIRLAAIGQPEIDAETRIVRFVLSDSSVARDGHTLATGGWDTDSYMKNPVVLFAHDKSHVASVIGRMVNVFIQGDRLMGDVEFMPGEINPMAETVFRMVVSGFLNAVSVGFLPKAGKPAKNRSPGCFDYSQQELLEVSVVPVPALASALVAGRAAEFDLAPMVDWARQIMEASTVTQSPPPKQSFKRDLGDVGWLAQLLQSLACLQSTVEWEAETEDDGSPIPQLLADAVQTLGSILVSMTAEEVMELMGDTIGEDRATSSNGQRLVRALGRMFAAQDRAGRVLSAANEDHLRNAHECLTRAADHVKNVMDQVVPDEDDGEGSDNDVSDDAERQRAIAEAEALVLAANG